MEFQEGICKLCLEKSEHCRFIDGNITNLLSMLLPNTDFAVIQGPVICRNCADMLERCHDFKAICLHTYKSIVPFGNKNGVQLSLKDVYLSKNPTVTGVPEDRDICGFCMDLVKSVSASSLSMLEEMTKQCLPELDLSIIKKLEICAPCLESLENCFRLVTNCLIAEEKIKKYCDTPDVDCKSDVELSSVLQFTKRHPTYQVDGNLLNKIKVEQQFCDGRESPDEREIGYGCDMIKLEETFIDDENVKIKNEIILEMDYGEDDYQFTSKSMLTLEEECDVPDFIKTEGLLCEDDETEHEGENLPDAENQTLLLNEEIQIKTEDNNFNRIEDGNVLSLTNNSVPAIAMGIANRKDPSEVTMYKCDSCSYQTNTKNGVKRRLLNHKDPSEVTMYRCDYCFHQTKYKNHFKKHVLKHMNSAELEATVIKCYYCSYKTKNKSNLKLHSLKHKDSSEAPTYNCDTCSYQTKIRRHLESHLLRHKDPSEVTMYKCDSCSFQTKFKYNLNSHKLKHKDPSEVTMYKCDSCLYQTKYKKTLEIHLLKHMDPSEVTMYKCDSCLYQSKYKGDVKNHLLLHKDLSEVTMYKCDSCLYQTKFKGDLKKHMPVHRNPSEIAMHKCPICLYQTKYKHHLKSHSLKHQDPSEVTIYKCHSCQYQTKYKHRIKAHLLKHGH